MAKSALYLRLCLLYVEDCVANPLSAKFIPLAVEHNNNRVDDSDVYYEVFIYA